MLMKAKVLAVLALTAAGAAAAGIAALAKKTPAAAAPAVKAAPAPSGPLTVGVYSFISGYQNPATVELSLRFNPETTDFAVVAEDFLSYSSASHVAIVESEDFKAQIEYAPYYTGEDFTALQKALGEKYRGLSPVSFGALSGVKYLDGDGVCLCFPIPEDAHSYLLMTLFKVKKDDNDPIEAVPDKPSVRALLSSAEIRVKK